MARATRKGATRRRSRARRRVLLTGGTGFIGRRVCAQLLQEGAEVDLLVRRSSLGRSRALIEQLEHVAAASGARLRTVLGDITRRGVLEDADELRRVRRDTREVIHGAAVYDLGVSAAEAESFNVGGTRNLLELAGDLPRLRAFHFVSTIAVSGDADGLWTESMLAEGQRFDDQYALTKYRSELLVREAGGEGLPVAVFRPGVVVGDSQTGEIDKIDGPYYVLLPLLRLERRLPWRGLGVFPLSPGREGAFMNAVPVDYVVRGLVHISGRPDAVGRTFCLTDPDPLTMRQFVELVTERLGMWGPWLDVDTRPLVRLAHVPVAGGLAATALRRLTGVPPQVLHYAAYAVRYGTEEAQGALAGSEVVCPPLPSYFDTLLGYARERLV